LAIGAVLFVGLDMTSLSAVGAFACRTSWLLDLLDGRSGGRRGRLSHARFGFGGKTRVEASLLLLSCIAALAVALEAIKLTLNAIESQSLSMSAIELRHTSFHSMHRSQGLRWVPYCRHCIMEVSECAFV